MSDTTATPEQTTAGTGSVADGDAGRSTPPANVAERTFTQEELNRILADDRRKEEARRKAEADEAARTAREAAAAEAGEWQTLAAQRAAERDQAAQERASLQDRYDTLAATVEAMIAARLKALPEELRQLAPDGTPDQRLAWLGNAEKAAAKLTAEPVNRSTPTGPRGSGGSRPPQPDTEAQRAAKRKLVPKF